MINYIKISPPKLWRWWWIQSYASKSLSQWSQFWQTLLWSAPCRDQLLARCMQTFSLHSRSSPFRAHYNWSVLSPDSIVATRFWNSSFVLLTKAHFCNACRGSTESKCLICSTETSTGYSQACPASCLLQSHTTFSSALIILVDWDWCR